MKAVVYKRYGSPDVLSVQERETPTPKDGEVLVRVHAASVNSWDWDMIRGKPWIVRMWGLLQPTHQIPGADIAGVVEATGAGCTRFKPGDEVYCDLNEVGWGGFAEYVSVPEKCLVRKPAFITFEEASAIPQAGLMALQAVRDVGELHTGQSLLIIGAGGGVGTFAIQLARAVGGIVTAVDANSKLEMLTSLGANEVVDYRKTDITTTGKKFDLIIDVVARYPLRTYKRMLNPGGKFLMIGGTMNAIFQTMAFGKLISDKERHVGLLTYRTNKGLDDFETLLKEGKVRPVIDRVFPMAQVREAFRYYASAAFKGKVIISMR